MAEVKDLITDNIDVWTSALKRKSSSGRGSGKKVELYGVKKLRELILDLAVRGLLVLRDDGGEPASVVIGTAKLYKTETTVKKGIRLTRENFTSKSLFTIPTTWEWTTIDEIGHVLGGKRVPRGYKLLDTQTPHAYIRVTDMKNHTVDCDNLKYIEPQIFDQISKYTINKEDIYITIAGSIGYVGSIPDSLDGMSLTENCSKLVMGGISKSYLILTLRSRYVQNQFSKAVNQMAQPKLSLRSIKQTSLAIPPLQEQHRIVAKVDELMALCDQLEQQTEASITAHQTLVKTLLDALTQAATQQTKNENTTANTPSPFEQAWQRLTEHFDTVFTTEGSIDQLKQTILQLAVMGKLVPQDPNDEPASELLKRIAAEKAKLVKAKKIKKQKALPEITDDEKPFELPVGWEWARISNASITTEYGISAKTFDDIGGIPVLKMGDIQSGQVILAKHKEAYPNYEGIDELMLEDGDLLYNRTNSPELVGKTGIFHGPSGKYSFASYLIRIKTGNQNSPEFVNLNMNAPLFRTSQIIPHLKQQCGQANVNGTIMKSMIVAIAPKNEQRKIVSVVADILKLCEQLKSNIIQAKTTQLQLADTIIKQAIIQ